MGQVHTQFSLYNIKDVYYACVMSMRQVRLQNLNTIIVMHFNLALAHVTRCL